MSAADFYDELSDLAHRRLMVRLDFREIDLLERFAQQLQGVDRLQIEDLIDWLETLADNELLAIELAEVRAASAQEVAE